jgi:hypothetical protein
MDAAIAAFLTVELSETAFCAWSTARNERQPSVMQAITALTLPTIFIIVLQESLSKCTLPNLGEVNRQSKLSRIGCSCAKATTET